MLVIAWLIALKEEMDVTGRRCYGQARTTVYYKENTLKKEESQSTKGVFYILYRIIRIF